jgi:EmrB/QacA subfamily drug resistance transporter
VRTRKRLILVSAILGSAIVFIDSTGVNVALPSIRDDLGGGLALQQWVVDAYLLTLGSLILVSGSLGDIFGARRMFTVGLAAFGVTSVLCALAPTGNVLIAARGLQGAAGALLTPAALAAITASFEGEERGLAIGTWTAWTGVAFIMGPLVGGWFVDVSSWRAIFLLNAPLVVVAGALGLASLPSRAAAGPRPRVDVVGAALCTLGLGGAVFGLIEGPRYGWSAGIVAALVGGVVLLALFVVWESRTATAMLPLELFRRRNFAAANAETLVVYAGLATLTFFLVLFLQQLADYSALEAGLALLPTTIVMFVLSRRVGALSMRIGPRLFMGLGPLIAAGGLLWTTRLEPGFSYWRELLPPVLVFSLGLTMIVTPLTTTVLNDAGPQNAGIASGINNAIARIAALLGIAAVGAATAGAQDNLDLASFHTAMAITVALVAAGGVIGLVGIRNP